MTQPIANARFRPMIAPILAPVIISAAITSVYAVIAPWIPVTVVPTSFATVAIETFITELSSVIRNCPVASVRSTSIAGAPRPDCALTGMTRRAQAREGREGRSSTASTVSPIALSAAPRSARKRRSSFAGAVCSARECPGI